MTLAERVVVVTGASRGIGRATAALLAERGATVVAGARDAADLASLAAAHAGVLPVPLDVADAASVEAFAAAARAHAAERDRGIDALVANAGVGAFGPVTETALEDWERVFAVNVRGTFLVTRAFAAELAERRGQVVVVTSDVSARTFPGGALYTASKHAQRAFARALQMELHAQGVRVTEVRPGVVATHFAGNAPRPPSEDALAAEDVAEVIAFALTRPARMRLDEVLFHPSAQAPEF